MRPKSPWFSERAVTLEILKYLDLDMSYPSNEIWTGSNPFYTLGFKEGEFMYSAIVMNLGIDSESQTAIRERTIL